ncbi:hypothetical protein GC207_13455 [bacterium]|nr:hypothetical protein [bacterium]
MPTELDFITTADKPALLGLSTPEWLDAAMVALNEHGYKVHTAGTHADFMARFLQNKYEIVITEELFAANSFEENETFRALQVMPMPQRRHCSIILLGDSVQTFNVLQAFQMSVHAVVNRTEIFLLGQLIQKVVEDREYFWKTYQEAQTMLTQSVY